MPVAQAPAPNRDPIHPAPDADVREQIHEIDRAWQTRGLFAALAGVVDDRNADDRTAAWRRFGPRTPTGRVRKMPRDKAKIWRALPEDACQWLRRRSDRRCELVLRIYEREHAAHRAARGELLDRLKVRSHGPMREVARVWSTAYRTQTDAHGYARGDAQRTADLLTAAGVSAWVGELQPYLGQPARTADAVLVYVVNARCEEIDLQALRRRDTTTLVQEVASCWARGLNPRVYWPMLPHGFEARHGIGYDGRIREAVAR